MSFIDNVKNLFSQKKLVSPLPQNEELTSPALLNWYANDQSRAQAAHLANQQRPINNYITPSPAPAAVLGASAQKSTPWNDFAKLVIKEGNDRGYNGEVLARQKALESGFGTSNFARERNNYGGIGAYDRDPNQAFNFKSPQEYLDYYFKLIENRYPDAYNNRANPQKYVEGLKKGGYASDPNYVWKVLNTPVYK